MRKLFSKPVLVFFLAATMLFPFAVSGWCAEKVMLRAASEYNDRHPTVRNGWFPWIEDLKEKTDGGLTIQFFNPNALVPQREAYDALVSGIADMVFNVTWRNQGKFPLADVIALPMLFNGSEAGSLTIWDLYQAFPEWREEYKDMKLLWQWTSATVNLHTKNKPVRTLADLRGLKIIGWNPRSVEMIRALGANPIEMGPPDTYLALERGMADGVVCPIAPMRAFKITDATKYHTIIDLNLDSFYAGINWRKWNTLPEEYQKLLEETTGRRMAQISGKTLDEGAINDAEWMKSQGHTFYVLPKDEKEKWRAELKYLDDQWIKSMEGRGYRNAREIYEKTVKLAETYSRETVGGYQE